MLHPLRTYLLFCLSALACIAGHAAEPNFDRWEKEIAAIEQRDAEREPAAGGVVFVGSSSIRLWDLDKNFADRGFANHGFGGSTIADSAHFLDRLVLRLKPNTIVLYAGDNDLANGLSPEQVHADFQAFVKRVREKLPEAKIAFIAIKPSPSRLALLEKQREANRLIEEAIAKDDRLVFVDIFTPMLNEEGKPREEFFVDDKLHLNEAGYELWKERLLPVLGE
jgi:lysophospholipase L1-like esterase